MKEDKGRNDRCSASLHHILCASHICGADAAVSDNAQTLNSKHRCGHANQCGVDQLSFIRLKVYMSI